MRIPYVSLCAMAELIPVCVRRRRGKVRKERIRGHRIEECAMKLSSPLVERTLSQFEAEAIPDEHPVIPELKGRFGDHTFFLDGNGLNIVEPVELTQGRTAAGRVVNLASWNDEDPPKLAPHEPESTDVVIVLESIH
jgi:hypothetical protein